MRKFSARIDANQPEIVSALRSVGCMVRTLSRNGEGVPDLLVGFRGVWRLLEIKDQNQPPSRRTLTPDQMTFIWDAQKVGCSVYVVESVADALAAVGARIAA